MAKVWAEIEIYDAWLKKHEKTLRQLKKDFEKDTGFRMTFEQFCKHMFKETKWVGKKLKMTETEMWKKL